MLGRSLSNGHQKTFVLVLDKGDEVIRELTDFATAKRLSASHCTAIGAFAGVTLGYFEAARKD